MVLHDNLVQAFSLREGERESEREGVGGASGGGRLTAQQLRGFMCYYGNNGNYTTWWKDYQHGGPVVMAGEYTAASYSTTKLSLHSNMREFFNNIFFTN